MKKEFAGLTLIETIIYLALFTIIIGGSLIAVYQILQASTQSQEYALIEEEGNFLMGKLVWAIDTADSVSQPTRNETGQRLEMSISPGPGPITFDGADGANLTMLGDILNSDSIRVEDVTFTHTDVLDDGQPPRIDFSFKLTSKVTGNSQTFSFTKYVRELNPSESF